MYQSIVVGTDGSSSATGAVNAAIALTKALGARLHVVCVSSASHPSAAMAATAGVAVSWSEIDEAAQKHARGILAEAKALAAAEGIDATVHACTGSPAETLVTVASGEGADLLVVGNRGMKGARRILGSVPNHVAHHAPCAVLIVPTV